MGYRVKAIESYLPEKIISNEYLNQKFGIDIEFLDNKIGIKERRIAGENETSSDLAYKAAIKFFDKGVVKPEEIDLILVCTQNPDYRLPTTACLLQHRLGLKTSCMAFDINLGCSGYIYSIAVAGSMLSSNIINKALLIMVDEYSKIIDYSDKNTASLFGDAATATILEKCEDGKGVVDFNFGTDGSGAQHLIAYNSGVLKQDDKNNFLYMNGREIFKFSITAVPASVNALLAKNNLKKNDIKYYLFHQANKYMLNEIKKKLELTDEQNIIDMEYTGNTVSSSIPLIFKSLFDQNKLNTGDLLVLCGFGVGLSWGSILYKY
jgi:3-oxoacyl-[acyl-carrier-protein] synthase III